MKNLSLFYTLFFVWRSLKLIDNQKTLVYLDDQNFCNQVSDQQTVSPFTQKLKESHWLFLIHYDYSQCLAIVNPYKSVKKLKRSYWINSLFFFENVKIPWNFL